MRAVFGVPARSSANMVITDVVYVTHVIIVGPGLSHARGLSASVSSASVRICAVPGLPLLCTAASVTRVCVQ